MVETRRAHIVAPLAYRRSLIRGIGWIWLTLVLTLALSHSVGAAPRQAAAAARSPVERQSAPAEPQQPAPMVISDEDARQTRERLENLLQRFPPGVGRVLKLDPSLLGNQNYLASYPAIAGFLAQHPEIARNPSYFFQHISVSGESYAPPDPQREVINMWENTMAGILVFLGFLTAMGTLAWLVRTTIDHRRWMRLTKVQNDVHSKLFDRFGTNEDLLTYIQSPAGRRYLESGSGPIDLGPRAISAPFGRILWSVQMGLVLAVGGLGMLFVSGRVPAEVAPLIFAIAIVTVSLGTGFVLSAVVSFILSQRLGLFERPGTPAAPPVTERG